MRCTCGAVLQEVRHCRCGCHGITEVLHRDAACIVAFGVGQLGMKIEGEVWAETTNGSWGMTALPLLCARQPHHAMLPCDVSPCSERIPREREDEPDG
jgi:hypothetical protein